MHTERPGIFLTENDSSADAFASEAIDDRGLLLGIIINSTFFYFSLVAHKKSTSDSATFNTSSFGCELCKIRLGKSD